MIQNLKIKNIHLYLYLYDMSKVYFYLLYILNVLPCLKLNVFIKYKLYLV